MCSPARVNAIYGLLQNALFAHSSIRVHNGKTQVWNRGGVVPAGVWRGDPALHSEEQGVRILGTPLGHPEFVRSQLAGLSETHDQLMEKVLSVQNLTTHSGSSTRSSLPVLQRTTTHLSEDASADSWGGTCQHLLGSSLFAIVSGRFGPPKRHTALQTRLLVELGRLFGATETPHRMCAHRGRFACSAPFFPLGRGPRLWGTSGSCWIPRTFLAGVGSGSSSRTVAVGRGHGTWPPPPWVATQSHRTCPWPSRGGHHQTQALSDRAGVVQIARRSAGGCPLHVLPHFPSFQDGFFPLPSAPSSAALASPPSLLAFLPVWPST